MRAAHIVAIITVGLMWGCGVDWFPDSTTTGGGFTNNSTLTNTSTASQYNNISTIFGNLSTASHAVSDSTGTITAKSVVAQETSRTATDVDFTLYVDLYNSGSTAALVEMELAGVGQNGSAIFKTTQTCLVYAKKRKIPGYTGLTVTASQWNKVKRWSVLKVTIK